MKHCTNPDCPHRTRTGQPAEYNDRVEHCSDCGTALVAASLNASTSSPAAEAGWPRDLVRRLTVTVLCLLPVWLSSLVWMPFVRHDLLREMLHLDGLLIPQGVSLLAVGITPFISAFVLVELVALMVPQWRCRRHGDPALRSALTRAALIVGVLVASVQALSLAVYFESLNVMGEPLVNAGFAFRAGSVVTLVAASCLCVAMARLIDLHGVGPGFVLLILVDLALDLPRVVVQLRQMLVEGTLAGIQLVLMVAAIVGFVGVTWWLLRRGDDGPDALPVRVPTCGTWPLVVASSLGMVPATLASLLDSHWLHELSRRLAPGSTIYLAFELTVITLVAVIATRLFYWRRQVGFVTEHGASWRRLQWQSLAFVLGSTLAWFVVIHLVQTPLWLLSPVSLIAMTAIVADLFDEVRLRRRLPAGAQLQRLGEHHDVADALEELAGVVRDAAIVQGLHYRSLTYFFAPYVPMAVLRLPSRTGSPG
ncbi:MAG: hypothetical protein ABIJ09_17470 [Pseudomonadota bacterium]